MLFMFVAWKIYRGTQEVQRYSIETRGRRLPIRDEPDAATPLLNVPTVNWTTQILDLVDYKVVDLYTDEYEEEVDEEIDNAEERMKGRRRWFWRLYYWVV